MAIIGEADLRRKKPDERNAAYSGTDRAAIQADSAYGMPSLVVWEVDPLIVEFYRNIETLR